MIATLKAVIHKCTKEIELVYLKARKNELEHFKSTLEYRIKDLEARKNLIQNKTVQ